ncbi:hypothetical protein H0X48_04870 [Candidatus Dependentiae bacterium]|nr:hypothetical protein [Candidatus Dependentiae bacterium]
MTVNLTLVLQAFHFFIAYGIVSRLVLKPALRLIEKEKAVTATLLDEILAQQALLITKQEHKRESWQRCQQYFNENKPLLEQVPTRLELSVSIEETEQLDKNQLDTVCQEVVKALKVKVLHD